MHHAKMPAGHLVQLKLHELSNDPDFNTKKNYFLLRGKGAIFSSNSAITKVDATISTHNLYNFISKNKLKNWRNNY